VKPDEEEKIMPYGGNHRKKKFRRQFAQAVLTILILAICFDYGKHVILKKALEREIENARDLVSLESLTVSPWPLFQSYLVLKKFQVNVSGTPLAVENASIRQGWAEWNLAHIHATGLTSAETVKVQEARGILDVKDLKTRVKVSQLTLNGIHAQLPFLAFSGEQASFDFLYEMTSQHLSLKVDAPTMAFANGATFGLSGEGMIETKMPIQGKMDIKIKNIDKMMKELVTAKVVDASQAELVTASSNFLGNIGLHDITLPLKIEDGDVSLGPLTLFKIGKGGS
jgi:hypothetical protein